MRMQRSFLGRGFVALLTIALFVIVIGTSLLYREKLRAAPIIRHTLYALTSQPEIKSPSIIEVPSTSTAENLTIPNIVNYVWIVEERPLFRLDFRTFLSIYSSHLYFVPNIIYIHTDATPDQWSEAKQCNDQWTSASLRLPNVIYHYIMVETHTTKGIKIEDIKHRSDFLRVTVLIEFGGIYMDTDVLPIRDIAPLRLSGFANIVGNEEPYRINNGILMAKKGSAMMSIYKAAQHDVFDNKWTTHSVDLLTDVSYRMQAVPSEVLVLGKSAFSPSSWSTGDISDLFGIHNDTKAGQQPRHGITEVPKTFVEAVRYWEERGVKKGREDWERDYSGSYLIHAFDGPGDQDEPKHVDFAYVLARQSNFARAAYQALKHAIDAGIIKKKDIL